MSKKLIASALTATTSVWLSGAMMLVPVAQAQSVEALQAQIASLLAQIQALQAQLATASGGSGGGSSYTFTRDLTVGSTGDDVKALQQFLNSHGAQVSASGAGAPGSESTYFGSKTKAALAKWQAANGVSPAAGYFGPKTRAAVSGMGGGTGGTVTPPSSGLAVALAADSPVGSAVSGAGQIKVGKFNFTASNSGAVVVTGLEFTKVGVVSDSSVSNLYLADAMTGEVIAQYQSLTGSVATFSGLAQTVAAGQTWVGELRMDLTGATAGNTIAWKLTKVVTSGGGAVTGTPQTNTLTVTTVSNPSLATATITETLPNASTLTVDAGTTGVLVSQWNVNVQYSAVNLTNAQYQFVGSANPADLKNLKLKVDGVDVATLAMAAVNTNFNFSAAPVKLGTGTHTVEIYADVMGSPNRTFRFSLLQPYRVSMTDTQYNTGISPSITNGTASVSINQGAITVSLSSNTPTAPVPNGAANQTLAKFRVYAAGEPVKVKFLRVQVTHTGGSTWATLSNVTGNINNLRIVDDAGGQMGNTISTVAGLGSTSVPNDCALSEPTITCYFGTSNSPINYIVPANTSRELSFVVDVLSTNSSTALRAGLPGDTSNLEGQISYQPANSGSATGATLQVTTNPLTAVANSGFSNPTYVVGATGVKIASFVVTAASAQGARINSLTFAKADAGVMKLQNMKVMVGTTQFGATRTSLSTTAAEASLAFSGTPIQVPQGGSVTIDVYADILTGSATTADVFSLTNWSALGNISNNSISFPGEVGGQTVTIGSGPTLTVARSSESAPVKQVIMGSTGNSLFTLRLSANNVEDVRVTDISLQDTLGASPTSTGVASFTNLTLWDGATQVAGPFSLTMPGFATSTVAINLGAGVIVPKNGSKSLELKGDVATFESGGALSGTTHIFGLLGNATSSVTALGKDSNSAATISGTPTSNTSTVYRTKVTLSSSLLGSSANRVRSATDNLATLTFAANSSFDATLNTLTLKFSGGAIASGTANFNVWLYDGTGGTNPFGSATVQVCNESAGAGCSVTFSPAYIVDRNSPHTVHLVADSSVFTNAASQADALSVTVNADTDVLISDGTTGGANIPLDGVAPLNIVTVSYE